LGKKRGINNKGLFKESCAIWSKRFQGRYLHTGLMDKGEEKGYQGGEKNFLPRKLGAKFKKTGGKEDRTESIKTTHNSVEKFEKIRGGRRGKLKRKGKKVWGT